MTSRFEPSDSSAEATVPVPGSPLAARVDHWRAHASTLGRLALARLQRFAQAAAVELPPDAYPPHIGPAFDQLDADALAVLAAAAATAPHRLELVRGGGR